jgi:carboxymethylenebutenolidase
MLKKIRFPAAGGRRMRAFLALPDTGEPRPAVIVLFEIMGLNEDIREKCERFAEMGYVALAPDLYDRGWPKPLCIARTINDVRRAHGPAFDHVDAARAWLQRRSDVDPSRIGVAGFCFGGGFALLYSARAPLGAAAAFYGAVPNDSRELEHVCPIVASYGGRDRPLASAPGRLESGLTEHGIPHDVKVYPEAGHSFMSDHKGLLAAVAARGPMRIGFDPEAAEDAWARVQSFFSEHLEA